MKGMTLVIYLDNAATTKPCKEAVDAVINGLEHYGNPSSLHSLGLEAENLVNKQREIIAAAIGAKEKEIFFTSCATESSNTAIFGAYAYQGKRKHRVVTTAVEHPSVANPIGKLEQRRWFSFFHDKEKVSPGAYPLRLRSGLHEAAFYS